MPAPENTKPVKIGWRILIIGALVALFVVPTFFIGSTIDERKNRQAETTAEIAGKWSGGALTMTGPMLTIPYKDYFKTEKGEMQTAIRYAHFLPDDLNISGTLEPEVRYRGIYRVALYRARLRVDGRFAFPSMKELAVDPANILWKDAVLIIGIRNVKGIQTITPVRWNLQPLALNPSTNNDEVIASGVHARLALDLKTSAYAFGFDLELKGAESIRFVPVAKRNAVRLSAAWKNPSFEGAFLPVSRRVDDKGFLAEWKVLDLNRNFPQAWTGEGPKAELEEAGFGVSLFQPLDLYQQLSRTLKYGIMFVLLTFLTFFMIEILNWKTIRILHPIQYLFIGAALILFYSLLLSLAEHLGFAWAYWIAALGIVGMVTGYARSVLRKKALTSVVAGFLGFLYGYLYFVLHLEDYALLVGNLGLFAILGTVMYLSRKVDWYHLETPAA
jgi:inner membrane protein